MDLHKFVEQFSRVCRQSGASELEQPPSEQGEETLQPLLLKGLSLATGCLESGEVYCEVGRGQVETLIAALSPHPDQAGYAIQDFSACPDPLSQVDHLLAQLADAGLTEQVWVCAQTSAEFFADFQASGLTDKIGIYVDRASHDYRSQLMSLLLAQPFWAEQALIVLPGGDTAARQQAIQDFLQLYPTCHWVTESPEILAEYGVAMLSWGTAIQLPLPKLPPAQVASYYSGANPELLILMPTDAQQVVEIGCGAGVLAEKYKQLNPTVHYVGVEINPVAGRFARQWIDRVVIGNVEQLGAEDLDLAEGSVDCLIYGDVLEHLLDPWQTLQRQIGWLKEGGQVIACVPNIQHWSILQNLLLGAWEYQDQGLLDRTHLRFFTLSTLAQMFEACGLQILKIKARSVGLPQQDFLPALETVAQQLGTDRDRFQFQVMAYQYVVHAVKPSAAG